MLWSSSLSLFLLIFCRPSLAKHPKISLQWAICETDAETVLTKLGHANDTPYKANPIVYYDTWPPQYTRNGIAFRTKVKKHDPGYPISMIKARFGDLNDNVPSAADCVWNRYGNDTTYTCGLLNLLSEIGGAEGEDLWSDEQVAFAARYEDVAWEELTPFGPYMNPKWKLHLLGMKAVFDDVRASPLHLMELEVVVKKSKGEKVYEEMDRFLRQSGVVLCDDQLPKTIRLLDYLEDDADKAGPLSGGAQVVLGE